MSLLLDGDKVLTDKPQLGPDEQNLLDALYGRGPLGERLKKDRERESQRAKYKLEVQFVSSRSSKLEAQNAAVVIPWESGRRFHGGGDQRMAFCGYWQGQGYPGEESCMKPIHDKYFNAFHLTCPHCARDQFLDEVSKRQHLRMAKQQGLDVRKFQRMPIANSSLLLKLSPRKMAEFLARIWSSFDSGADLYIKFHPTDIRCYDVPEVKKPDLYEKARRDRTERKENRGLLIYPLVNIIRDTSAGASLAGRFLAAILA